MRMCAGVGVRPCRLYLSIKNNYTCHFQITLKSILVFFLQYQLFFSFPFFLSVRERWWVCFYYAVSSFCALAMFCFTAAWLACFVPRFPPFLSFQRFLILATRWQCVSMERICHALWFNLNNLFRQYMPFRCIAFVSFFLIEKDMPCVLCQSYKDFQVILIY